uniref:Peptidase S1 domain-containing protein n=1 Tax=Tetraodon nigroviridis TaxID=99883 RepID=H3C2Z6_TETNG
MWLPVAAPEECGWIKRERKREREAARRSTVVGEFQEVWEVRTSHQDIWFAGFYFQPNFFCSGALISDQWVLTAATCVQVITPTPMTVVLGRTNQTGSDPKGVSRGINQTFCHPLYDQLTSDNNICLVQLSSPVELSDHISTVCLAAKNSTFTNGTFSWLVGPLRDGNKELMELQLQIFGNNDCQNRSSLPITDNIICTRDDPPEPCLDISGSPLLIRNDDLVWIQLGISLYERSCRKQMSPSVYTRVSRYQDWISSITGSSQPGFVTFSSSGDDGVSASTSSPPGTNTTPSVVPPSPNTTISVVSPGTTCDGSIFGSSEKLSSTLFNLISSFLFSLVLLVV